MKYYIYKMECDDGGAPCVSDGLLSLAICKPKIRSSAQVGDVIFGFAANSLRGRVPDNGLIYVAKISEKVCGERYILVSGSRGGPIASTSGEVRTLHFGKRRSITGIVGI